MLIDMYRMTHVRLIYFLYLMPVISDDISCAHVHTLFTLGHTCFVIHQTKLFVHWYLLS